MIANTLKQDGFTDVVNTQSEVAANRGGVRVSILHLHIADRNFWQVFMSVKMLSACFLESSCSSAIAAARCFSVMVAGVAAFFAMFGPPRGELF